MRVRDLKPDDLPALNAIAERSGFPYPDPSSGAMESVKVVVDDLDRPLMAVGAKRLVELYLWCGAGLPPHEGVAALRLLHDAVADELRTKGYNGAEAFLPPVVAKRFGRRLEKTFGWVRNWQSWTRRF